MLLTSSPRAKTQYQNACHLAGERERCGGGEGGGLIYRAYMYNYDMYTYLIQSSLQMLRTERDRERTNERVFIKRERDGGGGGGGGGYVTGFFSCRLNGRRARLKPKLQQGVKGNVVATVAGTARWALYPSEWAAVGKQAFIVGFPSPTDVGPCTGIFSVAPER